MKQGLFVTMLATAAIAFAGATSAMAQYGGGYRTQVSNPGLPQSFYTRYTGHDLSAAVCNQQATDLGWKSKIDAINAGNDNVLRMRAVITSLEGLIVITRQCENLPGADQQMASWATSRNQTITACRQTTTDPSVCMRSPF